MHWTAPDFTDISLNLEVTAYVLIDDDSEPLIEKRGKEEESAGTRP